MNPGKDQSFRFCQEHGGWFALPFEDRANILSRRQDPPNGPELAVQSRNEIEPDFGIRPSPPETTGHALEEIVGGSLIEQLLGLVKSPGQIVQNEENTVQIVEDEFPRQKGQAGRFPVIIVEKVLR